MCPNDCSGHGVCRTIGEIAANSYSRKQTRSENGQIFYSGVQSAFTYTLWDADMSQSCVCDPGYSGFDCSMRECPRGDDPLTSGERFCGNEACATAQMSFSITASDQSTLRFGYTAWNGRQYFTYATVNSLTRAGGAISGTNLPSASTNSGIMMLALRAMPGGFLQSSEVTSVDFDNSANACLAGNKCTYTIDYKAAGAQQLMEIAVVEGTAVVSDVTFLSSGSTVLDGNTESITCSGRGMCDFSSGLCNCFAGYFGGACEYQNALSGGGSQSSAPATVV